MGLSEQEKKFADEYVFLHFHAYAVYPGMVVSAAIYAGYDVSADVNKADEFAKSLLKKHNIKQYIDSEIERFRTILSSEQRRSLWVYISQFTAGAPEQEACYGNIIRH